MADWGLRGDKGAFVHLTNSPTAQPSIWRVGESTGIGAQPALAFSPDGRKLAGSVIRKSGSGSETNYDSWILIWPVPK
jgi:hypothetical protein